MKIEWLAVVLTVLLMTVTASKNHSLGDTLGEAVRAATASPKNLHQHLQLRLEEEEQRTRRKENFMWLVHLHVAASLVVTVLKTYGRVCVWRRHCRA